MGLVAAIVLGNTLATRDGSSPRPGGSAMPGQPTALPTANSSPTPSQTVNGSPGVAIGTVPNSLGWKPVAWSPDGSALLVRQGDAWAVMDASGRIESIEADAANWWPGAARTLSLVVRDLDGQASLELRPMEGGDPHTLVRQLEITAVAWSPDGETAAVAGPTGVLLGSSRGPLSPVTGTPAAAVAVPSHTWLREARRPGRWSWWTWRDARRIRPNRSGCPRVTRWSGPRTGASSRSPRRGRPAAGCTCSLPACRDRQCWC
jgi:hypothetical protein